MIVTLLLVVAMYLVLALAGWALLAPVADGARRRLLPAAPVFGASFVAAVSSTATRWLSMRQTLPLVGLLLLAALAVAVWRGQRFWVVPRRTLALMALTPVLTVIGVGVVGLPTAWVGDQRPVADTMVVDQYYYASNATYLVDHPMLPGPYWNPADPVGSAPPSEGPVVDVIANRLRYGQAAVASGLSIVMGQDPDDTVQAMSLLWLVLVGVAASVTARLLGAGPRLALLAVPWVTSSLFVTGQALEGKNDGLLGVAIGLLALGLSFAVMRRPDPLRRFGWPLVLTVAGLASVYSELVPVLIPPVVLLALLAPRRRLLARVNRIAGGWAVGALLAPFAWIWLAQSASIGGRFSQGATPFDGRTGLDLLRSVLGLEPGVDGGPTWLYLLAAVVVLVAALVGFGYTIARTPARGAALGIAISLAVLEVGSLRSDAGNLTYRTAQLGWPFVLVLVVVGWAALLRRHPLRLRSVRPAGRTVGRTVRAGAGVLVAAAVVAVFAVGNAATAVTHLPRARAEVQHLPGGDLSDVQDWVREVGPSNVSLVVPRFTDLAWLALGLQDQPGVGYPVVPAVYLGSFAHWDFRADPYYVVGVGATVTGGATVVDQDDRFELVRLGPTGMILSPYQPTFYWGRTTFMRGFPCARSSSQVLIIRGSARSQEFTTASLARAPVARNLELVSPGGSLLLSAGATRDEQGWNVQTWRTPRQQVSVVTLLPSRQTQRTGTTALPLVLGGADVGFHPPADSALTDFCLADDDIGMDGYDSNLTLLQTD